MNTTGSFSTDQREYRLKTWYVAIFVLTGSIFLVTGIFFLVMALTRPVIKPTEVLMCLFMAFMATYIIVSPLRFRLVISGTRIALKPSSEWNYPSSAELSQIEGFRTWWDKGGKRICICLKDGGGTINFSAYLKTDDAYRKWMEQIPDLDAIDNEARRARKQAQRRS